MVETEIEVELESLAIEELIEQKDLMVYNDDVNTFDHVINTLIKVCKHSAEQAEQCTWIIHYKGKCQVKRGYFDKLKPICTALLDKGLSAVIE